MNHIGILHAGTPFYNIFPTGEVILKSHYPSRPFDGAPLSFVLDPDQLSSLQIEQIAHMMQAQVAMRSWSYEDCINLIIKGGIAIDCKWFAGITSKPISTRGSMR